MEGTGPTTWDDPSLVQIWGPRFSVYVVAERDRAAFSLGRLPEDEDARRIAEDLAARLEALLGEETMTDREAGQVLGEHHNRLRYAATTGTVLIRWEGARRPTLRCVGAPQLDPRDARLELTRRYLHVFGPATPEGFAAWAGIRIPGATAAFDALRRSLTPVRTPIGDSWILARDEPSLRAAPEPDAPARLLPSGDSYYLLQGGERELLVPTTRVRELWTSRVWPGALLVKGDIVGTWRRAKGKVSVTTWRRLSRAERDAVEAEAESLPLPGVDGRIVVRWAD